MKFPKKTVRDVPIEGKTVLMRADFNVPFETDGTIADDSRIRQALPTIEFLLERKCRVVLCAHLGRPEGRVNSAFTLEPIAKRLRELLSERVTFIASTFGDGVKQAVKRLEPGEVMLLENLRFYAGEEENDPKFARLIQESVNADYFVQDGFGVVHRAHASTSAITHLLPSVSGLLLEREWLQIEGSLQRPKRPFIAVMGGAKISDKIRIIERFIELADTV
ncbi:phosphoglycerate kinase, partial [Candidatus Saccharibacteria bacterium]